MSAAATADSEPKRVCPLGYKSSSAESGSGGKSAAAAAGSEPPDTPDRPITIMGFTVQRDTSATESATTADEALEIVPGRTIPAAGRGNSDDGQAWLNPSPNQLYRALRRRDKPIAQEDALAVAAIHTMVTDFTWKAIMEYEEMHESACETPTLARFAGKDGIYSPKARFFNLIGINMPFDRHDWTVNRCGKEVEYIIDYYSVGSGDDVEYYIDARPKGLAGIPDRLRLAARKIMRGERFW